MTEAELDRFERIGRRMASPGSRVSRPRARHRWAAATAGAKLDLKQGRDPLPRLDRVAGILSRGVIRLDREGCPEVLRHGRAA